MSAAYDSYDYTTYWENRQYEHNSEIIAIKSFLSKIPKIKTILDIGAGFGRLTSTYLYRGENIVITDPSAKLLKLAREKYHQNKVRFIQTKLENIPGKIRNKSVDLIILVRVLHHLKDCDESINIINKLLKEDGHLIIEFANKSHFKATLSEFFKGNFTFPIDIFPKDIRSKKNKKKKTLPFVNYHPDDIVKKLEENGFEIVEKRSVSNIRSAFFKNLLSMDILLAIESFLQHPLSRINFGPSIFILANKKRVI